MKRKKIGLLTAAAIGGLGSLFFLLLAARNTPLVLLILFIGWVALPFAALGLAAIFSERWSSFTQTALLVISMITTVASLAVYFYFTLWPPSSTPARPWLIVPGVSLLIIASVPIAA